MNPILALTYLFSKSVGSPALYSVARAANSAERFARIPLKQPNATANWSVQSPANSLELTDRQRSADEEKKVPVERSLILLYFPFFSPSMTGVVRMFNTQMMTVPLGAKLSGHTELNDVSLGFPFSSTLLVLDAVSLVMTPTFSLSFLSSTFCSYSVKSSQRCDHIWLFFAIVVAFKGPRLVTLLFEFASSSYSRLFE